MNNLVGAFFLALIVKSIVAALTAPIKQKWPNADLWWLIYPSWVIGGVIAYSASLNLLSEAPGLSQLDPQMGRLLTAVIIGGGANLLHDIFDKPSTTTLTSELKGPGFMTSTVQSDQVVAPADTARTQTSGTGSVQVTATPGEGSASANSGGSNG